MKYSVLVVLKLVLVILAGMLISFFLFETDNHEDDDVQNFKTL